MPEIKERPILFSAPMVRAILEGRKTVTRQLIKVQPHIDASGNFCVRSSNYGQDGYGNPMTKHFVNGCCPYGKPGERLWVRETWARIRVAQPPDQEWVAYRECDNRTDYGGPWKPVGLGGRVQAGDAMMATLWFAYVLKGAQGLSNLNCK